MFMLVGLIPAFLIFSIVEIRDKSITFYKKVIVLTTFILLICLHSYFFENLGIGLYYPINN